jgi:kinesin family member 2/24
MKSSHFEVDRVFGPDVSTTKIHNDVVEDLVSWAWKGGIGTLFAYGQTGSGKTYTISQLEQLVTAQMMSDERRGTRNIFITIIELAGNAAFGTSSMGTGQCPILRPL